MKIKRATYRHIEAEIYSFKLQSNCRHANTMPVASVFIRRIRGMPEATNVPHGVAIYQTKGGEIHLFHLRSPAVRSGAGFYDR